MNTYRNNEGTFVSDDDFSPVYVRAGHERGFTDEQIVTINELRVNKMKYWEHVTTEDAVNFARAILDKFGNK